MLNTLHTVNLHSCSEYLNHHHQVGYFYTFFFMIKLGESWLNNWWIICFNWKNIWHRSDLPSV